MIITLSVLTATLHECPVIWLSSITAAEAWFAESSAESTRKTSSELEVSSFGITATPRSTWKLLGPPELSSISVRIGLAPVGLPRRSGPGGPSAPPPAR